jgi:hypothetical protein
MLFETADHYLQALSGRLNRLVYDFTQGLQVLDWEARCGRWLILKGELVQEGAEGEGELLLAKRSYRADQVRFFFDLTDRGGKGIIAVTFVQGPADAFGFAFSREEGYSAFASVGGRVTTVREPKFRLPADKRVRIRCGLKGDEFGLSVGSTKLPRLTAPGVSKLEGRFLLRTLDCRAAFNNLDISNRAE